MSIVVTTPTGNIGSAVVENLLKRGEKPVLIARDPAKVKHFTDRGAVVKKGSHSDRAFLIEATKGAQALFWLTPPSMTVSDIRGYYREFAEAGARAIRENKIPHVVQLSSVGAELESGNGPIAGIHVAENLLGEAAGNLTNLRPGYFMENTLAQIPSIQNANSLFTTFASGFKFPMIATRDIGARAAQVLAERNWTGNRVMELHGSREETGYDEVAGILSEVLGKKIAHVPVTGGQFLEALLGMGASKEVAQSFVELTEAMTTGRVQYHEPRTPENTTLTSYRQFAEEVFKPVFEAAS